VIGSNTNESKGKNILADGQGKNASQFAENQKTIYLFREL
jgi:hypothetical protein